jgi:mRNA-degrading endonuclease toxin of MazEF toxin-antitoxin module
MRQYELWWASLPHPAGRRPVLLLSRNAACMRLHRVTAVEVTTTIRSIPQEMPLGWGEGLTQRCVANFDNLHTIHRERLEVRIGALSPNRIGELKRALGRAFSWPELTLDP